MNRLGRPLRHHLVAVSAEALACAWARRDAAPHGATVVVGHEVAGRDRGGTPWVTAPGTGLAASVVLRGTYSRSAEDLLWPTGSLAILDALNAQQPPVSSGRLLAAWPDTVVEVADGGGVAGPPLGAVSVARGPGFLLPEWMVVSFHLRHGPTPANSGAGDRDEPATRAAGLVADLLGAFESGLEALTSDPASLLASYHRRCTTIGRRVRATLLPVGEARGTAREVDRSGRLVLRSPTGMVERVPVDALGRLTFAPP